MARVALIVTGRLEQEGLPLALARLFPDVEFVSEHVESFTSTRLSPTPTASRRPVGIQTNAEKMATAMMLALDPGRRGIPADFVFAVEDLELTNDDQAEVIVTVFGEAVRSSLPNLHQTALRQDRAEEQVPLRCSFHLLRPMIEAYFFADLDALGRAGAQRKPSLRLHCDLEDFAIDDPEYMGIIAASWPDSPAHARHPKWYLRWLCDPTGPPREKAYRETKGGLAALRDLDWNRVVGEPGQCPFLRSFLVDLADALELPLPFPDGGCHPLTARHNPDRRDAVLRNI